MGNYLDAEAAFSRADAKAKQFQKLRLQLLYGRAGMALSQNNFGKAEELARVGLAKAGEREPLMKSLFDEVVGLALAARGQKKEALAKCESARAALTSGHGVSAALEADLVLLEVRFVVGDRSRALRLFAEIQPRLVPYPESGWRALALAAAADKRYAGRAREALERLSELWGESVYNTYIRRPDVVRLSVATLQR
jgi:hypothetical protein